MKFNDYHLAPEIIKGIETQGFKRPTDIQYKSIPPILRGEDVLAVAQTGTGKTAAFAVPILHLLHLSKQASFRPDGVKAIVLAPTHELALQITEVFKTLGRFTKLRVLGLIGGVEQDPQIEELEKRVDILIATPGRMFDLISQGYLKVHRVEILVLDEADHMLDLGFLGDIHDLIRKLPRRRQTLFFSATINQKIKKLAYSIIHQNAIRIQISPKDPVSKNVEHAVAFIEMDDKRFFLERIFHDNPESKILVFVRTKVRAERVCKAMERADIESRTIHSDKEQSERTKVLKQFKNGTVKMLIATDVTARGIHIPNIDLVINYDLPDQAENYVHRVGRTGRGTQKGQAISFCSTEEQPMLEKIEEFVTKEIVRLQVTEKDRLDTRFFSEDKDKDWKKVMGEIDELEKGWKKRKKKKR